MQYILNIKLNELSHLNLLTATFVKNVLKKTYAL